MKNPKKDAAAQSLGSRGGFARARKLSPERIAEIARKAAIGRWGEHRVALGKWLEKETEKRGWEVCGYRSLDKDGVLGYEVEILDSDGERKYYFAVWKDDDTFDLTEMLTVQITV